MSEAPSAEQDAARLAELERLAASLEPADLDPELAPYLGEIRGMPALRHPLVYWIPYAAHNAMSANQMLRWKQDALREALHTRSWADVIFLHERPYRFEALTLIEPRIDDDDLARLLVWTYVDSENLWQASRQLPRLLRRAQGRHEALMSPDDRAAYDALPGEFTVYRGAGLHNRSSYSWTLSRARAGFFARRAALLDDDETAAVILEGRVERRSVVFFTNRRGEAEVVVRTPRRVRVVGEHPTAP
jgi:hypothetical protein